MSETMILTYRQAVIGRMLEVFEDWGVNTAEFHKGSFDLIDRLNNYKEEGEDLKPYVFLVDDRDFEKCNKEVALEKAMVFWQGKPFEGMYEWAVKKFAPLCRGDWKLFITIGDQSRIGLFGSTPAVTGYNDIELFSDIRGIAIRSIAENVVEVNPGRGQKIEINFNLRGEAAQPIFTQTNRLIDNIVVDLSDHGANDLTRRAVHKIVMEAVHAQHGFLAAVVGCPKDFKSLELNDVLTLDHPIDIAATIRKYHETRSAECYYDMVSLRHLIHGMMMSDGITFFSSCGQVLGFNGFVAVGGQKATGGARKRAFLSLKQMAKDEKIVGAFVQSQDGSSQWVGR